ncbi:MAG TPA: hypothetical protein VLL52_05530 [Anaerolineae bacterium]|nr:hypothetical protein [Anaerolineae bacterium]
MFVRVPHGHECTMLVLAPGEPGLGLGGVGEEAEVRLGWWGDDGGRGIPREVG